MARIVAKIFCKSSWQQRGIARLFSPDIFTLLPRLLSPPPPSFYHLSFCLPFFLPLFSFPLLPSPSLFSIFSNSQYTLTVWNFLSGEKVCVSTQRRKSFVPFFFFFTQLSGTAYKSPPSRKCIAVPPGRVNSLWQSTEKELKFRWRLRLSEVIACGMDICIFLHDTMSISIYEVSESLNSDTRLHRMWINKSMQIYTRCWNEVE